MSLTYNNMCHLLLFIAQASHYILVIGVLTHLRPGKNHFLVCDAFVRTNHRAIAMMFDRLFVCISGTGMHCDYTVHVSVDLGLWLNIPMLCAL